MGFLTVVVLYNDALHTFEEHPKEFAEAIFRGIDQASYEQKAVSVGLKGYANYIRVHPSRHADDEFVLLHFGNSVFNLSAYRKDFELLCKTRPELAKELIDKAKQCIEDSEGELKRLDKKRV